MPRVDDELASKFVCPKCKNHGGHVERLAMSGTGLSRLLEVQNKRYAFVSCRNCGYSEIYHLSILEGKGDRLGSILEILFMD